MRSRRHTACTALLALLISTAAAPSVAQQPSRALEIELSALFNEGQEAFQRGDYAVAADAYLEMAALDTQKTYWVEALHNAAVAFEMDGRYAVASETHRRVYDERPKHPYASYALYRSAVTAERALDFDEAIDGYTTFHNGFGDEDTPDELTEIGFSNEESGRDALASSARLLSYSNRHAEAAKLLESFATSHPKAPESPIMLRQAIASYGRAGDSSSRLAAIDLFLKRYGRSGARLDVLSVMLAKANHQRDVLNSPDEAMHTYQRVLDIYSGSDATPGSPEALLAAKAQYQRADIEFARLKELALEGSPSQQKKELALLLMRVKTTTSTYEEVYTHQHLEQTVSAAVRVAQVFEHAALTLRQARNTHPRRSAAHATHAKELEAMAAPLAAEALVRYATVLKKARDVGISNAQTVEALERLHLHDPVAYPLPAPAAIPHVEERQLTSKLIYSYDLR